MVLCHDIPWSCEVVPDNLLIVAQQTLTFLDPLCMEVSNSGAARSAVDIVGRNVTMEALRLTIRQ